VAVEQLREFSELEACDNNIYQLLEVGTISYEACAGVQGLGRYFGELASFSPPEAETSAQSRNQSSASQRDREGELQTTAFSNGRATNNGVELTTELVLEAYRRIELAENPLVERIIQRLKVFPHVEIMEDSGSEGRRLPVVAFVHSKYSCQQIVQECQKKGLLCRVGNFLSTDELRTELGGIENVVRLSLAHYNTLDEINRTMDLLENYLQVKEDVLYLDGSQNHYD
jgi:selenocysteine lyase/cysteine desulfurase